MVMKAALGTTLDLLTIICCRQVCADSGTKALPADERKALLDKLSIGNNRSVQALMALQTTDLHSGI